MNLVREYIDRYRGDEMEDIFKLLEDRLIQIIQEYVKKKAEKDKDKEWLRPDKWIQKILQDDQLGKETKDFWIQALLNSGYYKVVKESLDFERGLDPKEAMGVGIMAQILNYAKEKIKQEDYSWMNPSEWLWEIQEDPNISAENKNAWLDYLWRNKKYLVSKELQKKVDKTFESQGFQRGLDPKQAMNIGLEEQIKNFLDERTSSSPAMWISYLLTEGSKEELDKETRIKWIEFLIKKPEYNSQLGEEDYYGLKEWGIEWIPYVPFPDNNFKYEKIANNFIISFSEWGDFADYFDTDSRDISKEFIEAVLSGDSYEYFDYDYDGFDNISDFLWHISLVLKKGEEIPVLKELKEKAIEMGMEPEKAEDVDTLFNEIEEDDFSDLYEVLRQAYREASRSSDESEAYHHIQRAIRKHYQIEEGKWEGDAYKAPITLEGIKKLSYSMGTGEDKIKYYPPQSYSGTMTADDINDAISNELENL